VIESKMDA